MTDTRKAVRVKRSKNQCLGWESNPDHQIWALMLCRLSYRDPHLDHIIQPRFHLTADSVANATYPELKGTVWDGDLATVLDWRGLSTTGL